MREYFDLMQLFGSLTPNRQDPDMNFVWRIEGPDGYGPYTFPRAAESTTRRSIFSIVDGTHGYFKPWPDALWFDRSYNEINDLEDGIRRLVPGAALADLRAGVESRDTLSLWFEAMKPSGRQTLREAGFKLALYDALADTTFEECGAPRLTQVAFYKPLCEKIAEYPLP